MRVTSCQVQNFGSYKNLEFYFDEKGLCLIHGVTGSGKSTLCDIIPWVVFGQTAKGGSVNDIVAWNADSSTEGSVHLDTMSVHRSRNPNDLYFYEYKNYGESVPIRGKDMVDTQRLINAKLGVDADLYLSGAYFHEFSRTAAFFTATAKGRREICEQIVDLSLAETLKANLSIDIKVLEEKLSHVQFSLATSRSTESVLMRMKARSKQQYHVWEKEQKARIDAVVAKALNFDADIKAKIEAAKAEKHAWVERMKSDKKCPTCGGSYKTHPLKDTVGTSYDRQIEQLKKSTNLYEDQLRDLVDQVNPHKDTDAKTSAELSETKQKIDKLLAVEVSTKEKVTDMEMLTNVVSNFRGALVKRTIQKLQNTTNDYLTKHFDAEIRVVLSVESADKVETTIYKDGNVCVYTQLSKGQRQLLKLCFGLAVMRAVTNHHGVKFNAIFLDEAFDGVDDRFKVKAFTLLETLALSYESVFVVEHSSDLKALFTNQLEVKLEGGHSVIS